MKIELKNRKVLVHLKHSRSLHYGILLSTISIIIIFFIIIIINLNAILTSLNLHIITSEIKSVTKYIIYYHQLREIFTPFFLYIKNIYFRKRNEKVLVHLKHITRDSFNL